MAIACVFELYLCVVEGTLGVLDERFEKRGCWHCQVSEHKATLSRAVLGIGKFAVVETVLDRQKFVELLEPGCQGVIHADLRWIVDL
jgi:hypothetical protein